MTTTDRTQGDCPDGQHQHDGGPGPYCHSDGPMVVPDCAAAPQHHVAHDTADPDVHHALIVSPCPSTTSTDCASADMHYHANDPDADAPYCHSNAHQQRDACPSDLRLFREAHAAGEHSVEVTLACPPSEHIDILLTGASGTRLEVQIKVDAAAVNQHAEPRRTFRVYTTNDTCPPAAADCAVPNKHYLPVLKDADGNDITALTFDSYEPQTVYLHTLVDLDHGTGSRLLRIIVQDTHPLRGHVSADEQATLQPPLRGVN